MLHMLFMPGSSAREYWFDEGCWISEWSNTSADPDASIARARVPPGTTTRWHRLGGISERYVILAGRGRAEVGERSVEVGPGDVVVIAPGERQRIGALGESDLVFLAVCTPRFRPEAYSEIRTDGEEH